MRLCNTHASYARRNRTDKICKIETCSAGMYAREWCYNHYQIWKRRHTDPAISQVPNRGTRRHVTADGYVLVLRPDSPMAKRNGYVAEHRLVMSEALGRMLTANENVHHINGDRADNRLENLELWNTAQPAGQRVEDKVAFALEILALYRPEALA